MNPKTFKYDHQALVLFSLRSAVVIATVLAIPDAVALIPGATTITSWVLRLISCWLTALVLWFAFCSFLLHIVRLIAGGVQVDESGVKLWRFGRLIDWQAIEALSVEPEVLFTRLFSYNKTVRRFTIYTSLKRGPKALKALLSPHYVPSYLFSEKDFLDLIDLVVERKYRITAGVSDCLIFDSDLNAKIRRSYKAITWQRMFISVVIAFGVMAFLLRKTVVLYSFNEGLREFKSHEFVDAERSFHHALALEPTFAPAWHGLAGSEFSLGDFNQARAHWEEALKWKPDYVEAKVSLAYLCVQQRQFEKAAELLEKALHLDPNNSAALLNQADLNLRSGHLRRAVQDARLVLSRSQGPTSRDGYMATCLLADARNLQNKPEEASKLLAPLTLSKDKLVSGENLTYRLIVGARTCLKLNQLSKADMLSRMAFRRTQNVDTLLLMARVRCRKGEYDVARRILERVRRVMPYDPWVYVEAARVNIATAENDMALVNLDSASQCRPGDSLSAAAIGELYMQLGEKKKAIASFEESLLYEPDNAAVLADLEKLGARGGLVDENKQ